LPVVLAHLEAGVEQFLCNLTVVQVRGEIVEVDRGLAGSGLGGRRRGEANGQQHGRPQVQGAVMGHGWLLPE